MTKIDSLVSIGIPVFNEEAFINNTLISVINQTYKNIEIIISDNCSTDKTKEILESLRKSDKRIVLFRQPKNIGVVGNFDFVRKYSKGNYFMWLGGHDELNKDFIRNAVSFMEKNRTYSLYYAKARYFDIIGQEMTFEENSIEIEKDDVVERGKFVLQNLNAGTPIHGLFRSVFIKSLPLNNRGADDVLMLFLTALKGKIKRDQKCMYLRNKYRIESDEEVEKRYKSYGYQTQIGGFHLQELISLNHALYVFKDEKLSHNEKQDLLRSITKKFYVVSFSNYLKFILKVERNFYYLILGIFHFFSKKISTRKS